MKQTCPGCYRQWLLSVSQLVGETDREARSWNKGTEDPRCRLPDTAVAWRDVSGLPRSNSESGRIWERGVAGRCGRRAGKTSWAVATVHKASGGDWKFNFTQRISVGHSHALGEREERPRASKEP